MNFKDHSIEQFMNVSFHILETIDEPCSVINTEHKYVFVNKAYEHFYNKPRNEIIGEHIQAFIGKHFFEHTAKPFFEACLNGEKVKFLRHVTDDNGNLKAFEIKYHPYKNDAGEILGVIAKVNDATETVRLKEQLINSKQKWSNSVNAIDDALLIINKNFEIEDINKAGLQLANKKRYETIGKKCYEVIRGLDKPADDCPLKTGEHTENLAQREWYDTTTDRYFESKTFPIKNNKGEIIKYVDLLRDITERQKRENELFESKERFRSLFKNSLDGILYINTEGKVLEVNDQLLKILGSPSAKITKQINVFEFEPLVKMGYAADLKKCIITGRSVFGKNYYKSKWGKELYLRYYFNPIRRNNKIIGVLANVEDKTKEQEALLEKQKSEERYRILADNATDIVLILNINFEVLYVSPSCFHLTGFTQEEFMQLKGFDIIYKNDIELAYQIGRKILKGEQKRSDIRINKKNGGQTWIDAEGKAINYKNEPCILLTGRDISDRKKFEDKIQDQNIELTKLNKTKDKLFSIISHDLKNPLNNILGFSRILINNEEAKSNEKIYSFLHHIHQAADKLHIQLENLLNWSRSQLGAIQLYREQNNIHQQVAETLLAAKILADTKSITLQNRVPENTFAHYDRSLISVVLMNLVTNAIKFSHENCYIKVSAKITDKEVTLCVEDQGVGIDEEHIPKIFSNENFTTPGTNNEKGTGLGMGIVKEFVELNHGKIWVESIKNMGSRFFFTLPGENEDQ